MATFLGKRYAPCVVGTTYLTWSEKYFSMIVLLRMSYLPLPENPRRPITSVRLIYSAKNPMSDSQWLESVDFCTKLVMQVKEDQLLYGADPQLERDYLEMEAMGILPYAEEEGDEEEE